MSNIAFQTKLRAIAKAAQLAFARMIAKDPHEAEVVAWLFINEIRHIRGMSHKQAKNTKPLTGGYWICMHRYSLLGDQLFARVTVAEKGKAPTKPTNLDPVALAESMLPPQQDEWLARLAGPLGDWPPVDNWMRQSLAALGGLVAKDKQWSQIDTQLQA